MKSNIRVRLTVAAMAELATGLTPNPATAADKVRLSDLADVSFGTINTFVDQTRSQNVCAYTDAVSGGYTVTATGTGTAGAFTLAAGSNQLPYQVQWAGTPNSSSGTALVAGTTASGFTTNATHNQCRQAPTSTATLIVIIQGTSLTSATAGDYSGTLQITLAPN